MNRPAIRWLCLSQSVLSASCWQTCESDLPTRCLQHVGLWRATILLVCAVALLSACRHPAVTNEATNIRPPWSLGSSLRAGSIAGLHLSETNQGRASLQYTLTNETCILRIEAFPDLDPDAATMLLQEGIMGLQALYGNALSPYPGDISNLQVAQEKFRPRFFAREVNGTSYQYFVLFASERLGYGVTSDDSVKFKSLLGWLYCGTGRCFYKVRYFAPKGTADLEMERFFLALGCP